MNNNIAPCWENILGAEDCKDTKNYDIDISEVPGMDVSFLESIRKSSDASYLTFLKRINRQVSNELGVQIMHAANIGMAPTQRFCLGRYTEGHKPKIVTGNHGFKIDSDYTSDFLVLNIKTIRVKSSVVQNATLRITDQFDFIHYENTVNLSIGYNEFDNINISLSPKYKLSVTVEAGNLYDSYTASCYDACGNGLIYSCLDECNYINYNQIGCGGLQVVFTISCELRNFICENINALRQAYIYQTAIQLIDEKNVTPRANVRTERFPQNWKDLYDEMKSRREQAINVAIRNIDINDNYCVICRPGAVHQRWVMP